MPASASPPRPLSSRKLDILYLVFFMIHIPIILFVDLAYFYPPALTPSISTTLRTFYVETYADRFFISPPAWFKAFGVLEGVYHLPISIWFLGAIWNDHSLVPLHLLIFGLETAITTLTCLIDTAEWHAYSEVQRGRIYQLYAPYLVLALLMVLDGFIKVKQQIMTGGSSIAVSTGKKTKES
ncbi:hypothetical protein PV10_07230 [Exophiala mesophila]|uniref:Efficient mitochondria targeting-associated protein 19 n=1 Tax=Exophiala mesophila TaxID=212818 RepID=A0A0D1Z4Y1_EXOME|nr:uncharacterized protein PV10_07230 [Exophiala mesophila]KIV89862.1 hypothetical protein PV10_07230 [Exophiala mesophila]